MHSKLPSIKLERKWGNNRREQIMAVTKWDVREEDLRDGTNVQWFTHYTRR